MVAGKLLFELDKQLHLGVMLSVKLSHHISNHNDQPKLVAGTCSIRNVTQGHLQPEAINDHPGGVQLAV